VKRVLVDLNVVLDVALRRPAHFEASAALCLAIEAQKAVGFFSAHAFPTFYYVARKHAGQTRAMQLVVNLARVFRVASINDDVIARSLTLGLPDYEDAVTAAAAEAARCELIVTRDPRGFAASPVTAVPPELGLAIFESEVHEPIAVDHAAAPVRRRRRRSHADERLTAASRR